METYLAGFKCPVGHLITCLLCLMWRESKTYCKLHGFEVEPVYEEKDDIKFM
jgi:hypothetical protein